MLTKLSGYKTYIIAGAGGVLTFAKMLGWIDATVYDAAMGFLGSMGLATLRAGVTKSGPTE